MTGNGLSALASADLDDASPQAIVAQIRALEHAVRELANTLLAAIGELNKRLDGIDNRLVVHEQHLAGLERRVAELETKRRKARKK